MVGLIIASVVALTTLIASASTSALALAQEEKTSFVNHLAEYVINALRTQEDLDKQLEQRIDTLYDIVQIMGDEVQGMKVRTHLELSCLISLDLYKSKDV